MSGAGSIDIRVPIGALFTSIGVVIAGYGIATNGDPVIYGRTGGLNINIWWGAIMLVFGALFLFYGRRAKPSGPRPAMETPEGRATEAREHREGLERE